MLWFLNGFYAIFSLTSSNIFTNLRSNSSNLIFEDLIIREISPQDNTPILDYFPIDQNYEYSSLVYLRDYKNTLRYFTENNFITNYKSQIGGQVYLLYPVWKLSMFLYRNSPENLKFIKAYSVLTFFTAILTGLTLAILLTLLAIEFSIMPIALSALWIIFSNIWLTGLSSNLYFQPFLWFLPMIWAWYLYYRFEEEKNLYLFGGIFILSILKSSMGYEYVTVVWAASCIPAVYFSITRGWTLKKLIQQLAIIIIASVMGIMVSFTIHAWVSGGFQIIVQRFYWRTVNTKTYSTDLTSPSFIKILLKNTYHYIFTDTWAQGIPFFYGFTTLSALIIYRLYGQGISKIPGWALPEKKYYGLMLCALLSIAGAFSHHYIFAQHSYIHRHLNYVLWYLPFWFLAAPLGFYYPVSENIQKSNKIE